MPEPINIIPKPVTEVVQRANNIPQQANLQTLRNAFTIPDSVKIIIGDRLGNMPPPIKTTKPEQFQIA